MTGRKLRSSARPKAFAAALAMAFGVCLTSGDAMAWHHRNHQLTTDYAWQVMAGADNPAALANAFGTLSPPAFDELPDGADAAEWQAFLADVAAAVTTLPNVRSGVDAPKASSEACNGIYPDPDEIKDCRLSELLFRPGKDWVKSGGCQASPDKRPGGIFNFIGEPFAGANLGRLSVIPDDLMDETRLWVRVQDLLLLEEWIDAASTGLEYYVGAILFVPACAYTLLDGGSLGDCWGTAQSIADDVNFIEALDDAIPGITLGKTDFANGFWHLMNLDAPAGEFNDVRALHYDFAGPAEPVTGITIPGVVDVTMLVGSDLLGLGLDVSKSDGVRNYEITSSETDTPSPSKSRSTVEWQSESFGHIEMNPLDNLAQFGWDKFLEDTTTLEFLQMPLHALGDVTVPMHVVGSSSWGHQPLEEAADDFWGDLIFQDAVFDDREFTEAELLVQLEQARRVLLDGFRWWKWIRNFRTNNPQWTTMPIRPFITEIAEETRVNGHELLNDHASFIFHIGQAINPISDAVSEGLSGALQVASEQSTSAINQSIDSFNARTGAGLAHVTAPDVSVDLGHLQNPYVHLEEMIRERIEASAGAQVAFLTLVGAEFATPMPDTDTTACTVLASCPASTPHRVGLLCLPCPAGEVLNDGSCDTQCDAGESIVSGVCVGSSTCPSSKPFSTESLGMDENGFFFPITNCHAQCPNGLIPLSNTFECVSCCTGATECAANPLLPECRPLRAR